MCVWARVERWGRDWKPFGARVEGFVCDWIVCVCHAFNARPEGATSSQPRASERSDATPWVRWRRTRCAPGGGKSSDRGDVGWGCRREWRCLRRVAGFVPAIGGVMPVIGGGMPVIGGVNARWWRN